MDACIFYKYTNFSLTWKFYIFCSTEGGKWKTSMEVWNRSLFQEAENGKIAFSIEDMYSTYGIIQVNNYLQKPPDINTYRQM